MSIQLIFLNNHLLFKTASGKIDVKYRQDDVSVIKHFEREMKQSDTQSRRRWTYWYSSIHFQVRAYFSFNVIYGMTNLYKLFKMLDKKTLEVFNDIDP